VSEQTRAARHAYNEPGAGGAAFMAMALLAAGFAPPHTSFALQKAQRRCGLTARRSAQHTTSGRLLPFGHITHMGLLGRAGYNYHCNRAGYNHHHRVSSTCNTLTALEKSKYRCRPAFCMDACVEAVVIIHTVRRHVTLSQQPPQPPAPLKCLRHCIYHLIPLPTFRCALSSIPPAKTGSWLRAHYSKECLKRQTLQFTRVASTVSFQ
jgi:hypothetical protein